MFLGTFGTKGTNCIAYATKDNKVVVDATYGRRTRAVLIMDSGHIILSAVQPETVAGRVDKDIGVTPVITEISEEKEDKEEK